MPSTITFEPAGTRGAVESRIAITSPAQDEVVTSSNGAFTFQAKVENFDIGPFEFPSEGTPPCAIDPLGGRGGGQHLYLIIDNDQSYKIYGTPQAIVLEDPSEGEHIVRAFLSRSWEESMKGPTEDEHFSIRRFYYNSTPSGGGIDRTVPLLSCNAPLGPEHDGPYKFDHVMVDFFVMFGEPGNDCGVHVTLKDNQGAVLAQNTLTGWEPHCIKGLPEPEAESIDIYHLTLRMVDGDGQPLQRMMRGSDMNTIEREFHVVRELSTML